MKDRTRLGISGLSLVGRPTFSTPAYCRHCPGDCLLAAPVYLNNYLDRLTEERLVKRDCS